MKIEIYHRHDCAAASGVAVVIDVIRAFTTAAFAFDAGASRIVTVTDIEHARALHRSHPEYLLMGESEGLYIEGFHFENSPSQFKNTDIRGRTLIQRTSSGTQGIAAAQHADHLLASSFVVAQATLERIRQLNPKIVSFIITGRHDGSEDLALARYLEACLLHDRSPDPAPYLDLVRSSPAAQRISSETPHAYREDDLKAVLSLDQFPFYLEVNREPEGLTIRPAAINQTGSNPSLQV